MSQILEELIKEMPAGLAKIVLQLESPPQPTAGAQSPLPNRLRLSDPVNHLCNSTAQEVEALAAGVVVGRTLFSARWMMLAAQPSHAQG